VNQGYEAFCMVDPSFYDAMHSEATAGEPFPTAGRPLPYGWRRHEQDDWLVFRAGPATVGAGGAVRALPDQGWKIHVSACLDNAERILDTVWDYCLTHRIDFKFLRSPAAHLARVSKYADRASSGKLVTIYPVDEAECETVLTELGERLAGEPSPYILSDLRWGDGPLYVRYGAIATRFCLDETGEPVPAIVDDAGMLVPDRRDPIFHVPPWVPLPDFLRPHLEARNATRIDDLPYTIERVMHFSNGGGVYAGRDTRTGRRVVLKEARPHAGLDGRGEDAVSRLEREYEVLRRLADVPGVPDVYDMVTVGEHRFCVMEHVDGEPLNTALVRRYPLTDPVAGPPEFAKFTDWAIDAYGQVDATIREIHRHGFVYGDLHLFNPMVREDGRVVLLDFEVAAPVADATRPGLGNQGFSAPHDAVGIQIDDYALACLKLALFLPMTTMLGLYRPKAREFAQVIEDHFPIPPGYLDDAVDLIARISEDWPPTAQAYAAVPPSVSTIEPDPVAWPQLRADLARAIEASATPERADRLFPGDIQQFDAGGLGLAHGAAGVLYALSATGAGRHPEHEEWLVRHALNPVPGTRPGLYDGLHGAAFALERLGYRDEALDVAELAMQGSWEALGTDLFGGLSGIGLSLAHLGERTGEPALRQAARRTADLVAERWSEAATGTDADADGGRDTGPLVSGGGQPVAGLLHGGAGAARFLLRAYDEFGDASYLDAAAVGLRHDLRRCVVRADGAMEVNEGWRTMPYLERGSVGIAIVLDEYLAHRSDDQFAAASRLISKVATSPFYIQPGLFAGRAGILAYLARRSASPATDAEVAGQIRALAWHALPFGGGTAFPGHELLRLSMDLATGTAGVLLALGMVLHDRPVHLPLAGDRRAAPTPAPAPRAPAPAGAGI
jgi:hypothetical protein